MLFGIFYHNSVTRRQRVVNCNSLTHSLIQCVFLFAIANEVKCMQYCTMLGLTPALNWMRAHKHICAFCMETTAYAPTVAIHIYYNAYNWAQQHEVQFESICRPRCCYCHRRCFCSVIVVVFDDAMFIALVLHFIPFYFIIFWVTPWFETCKLQSSFSLITVADIFNGRQSLLLFSFSSVLISYECFWPTCWYPYSGIPYLVHAIYTIYIQLFLCSKERMKKKNHSIYSILVIFLSFCNRFCWWGLCLGRHRVAPLVWPLQSG